MFIISSIRSVVIKYPLITKKTSTPTKPPLNSLKPAWKKITGTTARVLKPSISARYFKMNYSTFNYKFFYMSYAQTIK